MKKSFVSPTMAWIIAALLFVIGAWQFSSEARSQGAALVGLALIWVVIAIVMSRNKR